MEERLIIRDLEERDFPVLNDETELWGIGEARGFLEWFASFRPGQHLSLVATVNDRIIGFYLNLPSLLKVGGRVITAFRGAVGVHPCYRRKPYNVFTSLVKAVHERCAKRGAGIYGFPRLELLRYYVRKLQIREIKRIPRYVRDVRGVSGAILALLTHRSSLDPSVVVREIHSFNDRFNFLWEGVASKMDRIMGVRNQEYLDWRYCRVPGERNVILAAEEKGRVAGYVVVQMAEKQGARFGSVLDLLDVRRPNVTRRLLLEAVHCLRRRGATQAECYISDGYYENALMTIGFTRKDRLDRGDILMAKFYLPEVDSGHLYNPEKWFITKADMLYA